MLAVIFFLLLPVLFPDNRQQGWALNANRKPIKFATLTFRDPRTKQIVCSVRADANGYFRLGELGEMCHFPMDGYILVGYSPSTGGSPYYYFAPIRRQGVQCIRIDDKPIAGLSLTAEVDERWSRYAPQEIEAVTDARGMAPIGSFGATVRYYFYSNDSRYAVRDTIPLMVGGNILYRVRVERSGTIVGYVRQRSGNPIGGVYAFAEQHGQKSTQWEPPFECVTGAQGRFRIEGLLPGTYDVGVRGSGHTRLGLDYSAVHTTVSVRSNQIIVAPDLVVPDFALPP